MYDCRRRRRSHDLKGIPRKKGLTKAERYILKINEGCGSRKFKDFLLSKPMDAYMTSERMHVWLVGE